MVASALGGLGSAAISAGAGLAEQEGWQNLTAAQQQFLMQQLSKLEGIQLPQFDTNLSPPEQLALEKYAAPILAQSQQVNIDPQDRANQMAALQKMQGLASGAENSELNAANYKAMQNAAQQQHSQNASILQNMASRGTLGSGQELAAKMQAAQNSAGNSQAGMLQAAQNNALERMQANNQYLQGMGALRGQDTELASKNADIINQFNLANTGLRNQVNQMNTNLGNQQAIYNTGNNNEYRKDLINLKNTSAQQGYADAIDKAKAAAGQANNLSSQAMGAGATGMALGANTASGIAQGIGNAANSLSGMFGNSSGSSSSGSPDVPNYKLTNPWPDEEEGQ